MQKHHVNNTPIKKRTNIVQPQNRSGFIMYRDGVYSCLIWWGIGSGIGLLFAFAVEADMKQSLAEHLQNGIVYLMEYKRSTFIFFLKRCIFYSQLFLLIWCMQYFVFGHIGTRMVMLGRGFIYGFTQTAWVLSYGVKGVFLGLISYFPHNFILVIAVALMEWLQYKIMPNHLRLKRRTFFLIAGMVPIIAWVEAYVAQNLFLAFV